MPPSLLTISYLGSLGQKRLESAGSLSAFLYGSEPERSISR